MANILVTGGAGFIGSHIVDALLTKKHRLVVVDDLSSGHRHNLAEDVQMVREDIRSPRIKDIFRDFQPQYVFHLAAQKNVRASVEDPIFDAEVNITGSLNILEQCRRFRVTKIIFSSSGGAMYGPVKVFPTPESVPPRPASPYGIAKYTFEQYLRFYRSSFGVKSVSLRYANVYGPRQDPKGEAGVVAIFAERLMRRESLRINGDGKQTRDYVFVDDVVAANILAMKPGIAGEINIGTGVQTSVNRLADLMTRISGRRSRASHHRVLTGEVMRSALHIGRAKRVLKWKPAVPLRAGLEVTMQWAAQEWPMKGITG